PTNGGHIRTGDVYEPSTSRAEKLSDAAAGWVYRRILSHRRRHRTIGSILRKGLRRSHFEQRPAGVQPDRERLAHCQRRRRADPHQTNCNVKLPRRPRFSWWLYEYPRRGYSSLLWRSRGAEFITEPKEQYGE